MDFGRLPDTKVEFSLDSPHQITSWYVWSCLKKNDISVCVWNNCCAISCLFHQVSSTPLLIFFSDCHLQFCKEDARLADCKVQHAWKGDCNQEIHHLSWLEANLEKPCVFSSFYWIYKWTHELLKFLSCQLSFQILPWINEVLPDNSSRSRNGETSITQHQPHGLRGRLSAKLLELRLRLVLPCNIVRALDLSHHKNTRSHTWNIHENKQHAFGKQYGHTYVNCPKKTPKTDPRSWNCGQRMVNGD